MNLTLHAREARGVAENQWAALIAAHQKNSKTDVCLIAVSKKVTKKINQNFFKAWSSDVAYVLGYFVADGCISISNDRISNPYTFNITSVDLEHLYKIKEAMCSEYKISKKFGESGNIAYQI